jgi:hypothetical protein
MLRQRLVHCRQGDLLPGLRVPKKTLQGSRVYYQDQTARSLHASVVPQLGDLVGAGGPVGDREHDLRIVRGCSPHSYTSSGNDAAARELGTSVCFNSISIARNRSKNL